MINCILQRNPASGFGDQHRERCTTCPELATLHINLQTWCGNVCQKCADRLGKRAGAAIENETVIARAV